MAIERFAEKLDTQKWEPLRILEAEKEKLRKANNELAKMKYISSRMYNIMKKNDIFLETVINLHYS